MSSPTFIETTGDSVEEAIAKGLAELGVGPTEVIVEVLDEPSRGVFGIGARPARVRLQMLSNPKPPPPEPQPEPEPQILDIPPVRELEDLPPRVEPERETHETRETRERSKPQGRRSQSRPARQPRERAPEVPEYMDVDDEDAPMVEQADEVPEAELDDEASIARVVLGELLLHMSIRGRVVVRRAKPDGQSSSIPWVLDVTGGNLTRLIGRRGETLAALQYITRLITSRELQRRSEVIVDVEGYKARRAAALHALALRMAEEAVEKDRTISLEPMPPHERRIIHLALRGREDVVTRSVGEGTGRKVTIVPSSQA